MRAAPALSSPATSMNHGPAHSVCTAICEPDVSAASGATRQKAGEENTVFSPLSMSRRLSAWPLRARRGTARNIPAAATAASPAMPMNNPRQPKASAAMRAGTAAVSSPSPPAAMMKEL